MTVKNIGGILVVSQVGLSRSIAVSCFKVPEQSHKFANLQEIKRIACVEGTWMGPRALLYIMSLLVSCKILPGSDHW